MEAAKNMIKSTSSVVYCRCLYIWLEVEVSREDVAHNVVVVSPLDQPFSLHACVHGGPAVLTMTCHIFHESPHRTVPHWHRTLIRED